MPPHPTPNPTTPVASADDILRPLEQIARDGGSPAHVFDDWLELVEAALATLPQHARALAETGRWTEDPPEVAALWTRIRAHYPDAASAFEGFAAAFGALLATTHAPDGGLVYQDALGTAFMQFGRPNEWRGQFFTPFHIAAFMAAMACVDLEAEIHARLQAAVAASPAASAVLLAGGALQEEAAHGWFLGRVVPLARASYAPITVLDPCCGSGVMLLAAASRLPQWAVALRLVEFWGVDLDPLCVRMARVNCQLYGLNGHGLANALGLSPEALARLPEPYARAYAEAQAARRPASLSASRRSRRPSGPDPARNCPSSRATAAAVIPNPRRARAR